MALPTERTVTGRYVNPVTGAPYDGTDGSHYVIFEPVPDRWTDQGGDQILIGGGRVTLEADGSFAETLVCTDAPDVLPAEDRLWRIRQYVGGVWNVQYFALPSSEGEVDLTDLLSVEIDGIAYVPVPGPAGPSGAQGEPGLVQSVNGYAQTDISLTAADVGALSAADRGAPGGVAALGPDGLVPAEQLPASSGSVSSVNGQTGAVVLNAGNVGAIPAAEKGAAGGVATLGLDGKVTTDQLPADAVSSVNGQTGAVVLGAGDVGAVSTASVGAPSGVAALDSSSRVPVDQIPDTFRPVGVYNVRAHGAVGDGVADDAPAFQAALDAARAAGGGWVLIPPGNYLLATLPLRVFEDTRVTGAPGAVMLRGAASGALVVNGETGQTLGGYTGHGRIIIEGGVWDMRGSVYNTTSAMGFSIGHARDVTFRDLEIRDVTGFHAIELNSTKNARILNCSFRGFVDPDGTRDFSEAVQIDLAKGSSYFGAFGPYDHTPCEDVQVSGCYFGASGTTGTTAWPRGVGSHSATIDRWHRRIVVSGCFFEGLPQYAVSAYNWEDSAFTGNTFQQCGSGVRLRSVIASDPSDTTNADGVQTNASQLMRNLTITGNTFRSMTGYDEPIVALGETSGQVINLTVGDNTIDGAANNENGIRLQNVERFTITGNAVANSTGTAVSTETCHNGVIAGNTMLHASAHGLTLVNDTNVNVADNNIMYPSGNGILIQGGSNLHLRGNSVKSPGRGANATYYGIRISSSASSVTLTGNKVRPHGSGNEALFGLSITSTCSLIHRYGNDWRGAQFTSGALADDSPTPNTSSADLT